MSELAPEIRLHYEQRREADRLTALPAGRLEFLRTQALLARLLPPAPGAIADVGGGAGIHALPLAARGFEAMVEEDVLTGRHANPDNRPGWFTTAYFHDPAELGAELETAGFALDGVFAVEGPGWTLPDLADRLDDEPRREQLLRAIERVETAPALLGASAHLLAVGRR